MAAELERRWNEKLGEVRSLEDQIEAMATHPQPALSQDERTALMRLGADLEQAWSHPAATTSTRKRIVRAVLNEIVVRVEDGYIDLVLHWQGGDHTALRVKKNTAGRHRWTVAEDTEVLVRDLARLMPDMGSNSRAQSYPITAGTAQPNHLASEFRLVRIFEGSRGLAKIRLRGLAGAFTTLPRQPK